MGWNIHNEAWCKAKWLDLLKLRFWIGNPGNQNFDAYTASGTYIYNSAYQNLFGTSAILEKFGNPNLKWQKTIDKNLGLDVDIFDRVKFSVDFYHKNTDPLLAESPRASVARVRRASTPISAVRFRRAFRAVSMWWS